MIQQYAPLPTDSVFKPKLSSSGAFLNVDMLLDDVIEPIPGWRILRLEAACAKVIGKRIQLREIVLQERVKDGVRVQAGAQTCFI